MLSAAEEDNTFGKIYMKCQYQTCGALQWFEDAKHNTSKEKTNDSSSSDSSSNCFQCGQPGHWARTCPWKETKCPNGCPNVRNLWTSRKDTSYGRNFLKCITCGGFQWLDNAISSGEINLKGGKVDLKVKIEVSLDDMCNSFKGKNIA